MSIEHFIPEIWSAALLTALRDQLTYAQPGMINRSYEGDISRAGDTVRITSIQDVKVREYTRNSGLRPVDPDTQADGTQIPPIQYDILNDLQQTFVISQADYWAFGVDDLDERQALSGFVQEATQSAAYGLAAKTDDYVANLMVAGAGNDLGAVTIATPEEAYELLVQFRTELVRTNTPATGRWVVVPPEFYAMLLLDPRFVDASQSGTAATLRNGQVGRAAGFDVIESNRVPEDSDVFQVVAGHSMATTFADQLAKTEALTRLEGGFSDAVRGLHLYDGKVLEGREGQLVKAQVTISPSGS